MTDLVQIWWIRHLPVAESGRYIGQTDIPALVPPTPANLAMPLPKDALWFASPMLRTTQTAHWLMEATGELEQLDFAPELMEQNFGEWEGKTYDEVWEIEQAKTRNWTSPAMVKPENGESFIGVCARVDHWLDAVMQKAGGRPIVIVAHAGTIRAALRHALNINPEPALSFCVDYGSVTQIEYFPTDNSARVVYVNR